MLPLAEMPHTCALLAQLARWGLCCCADSGHMWSHDPKHLPDHPRTGAHHIPVYSHVRHCTYQFIRISDFLRFYTFLEGLWRKHKDQHRVAQVLAKKSV